MSERIKAADVSAAARIQFTRELERLEQSPHSACSKKVSYFQESYGGYRMVVVFTPEGTLRATHGFDMFCNYDGTRAQVKPMINYGGMRTLGAMI